MSVHEPVLLNEVLTLLSPQPNQNFIDCTYGGGGHAQAIAEKVGPNGRVIGIEWDAKAAAKIPAAKNITIIHDNYRNLPIIIKRFRQELGWFPIHGILLDLGLSSDQLATDDRGFSFQTAGPLDLRYDPSSDRPTAADIIKAASVDELTRIFRDYGDEPLARPIAREMMVAMAGGERFRTVDMLVQLVTRVYATRFKSRSRHHPATRVFQALRIAVNDEFGNIRAVLPQAVAALTPGGRLAVISFHSGEDRLVKQFFTAEAKRTDAHLRLISKKPVTASIEELAANPRSRSAKLRVVEKI